jgi:hypothetical protein
VARLWVSENRDRRLVVDSRFSKCGEPGVVTDSRFSKCGEPGVVTDSRFSKNRKSQNGRFLQFFENLLGP